MSEIDIDSLADRGTVSTKDVRVRRIYNEEPSNHGLTIEAVLSTLDIIVDDSFTTSVTGDITVGATGHYDMDLEQYWDINTATSGCIHTRTGFCLDIGSNLEIMANSMETNITGAYDVSTGGALSLHSTGDLWLDAGSSTINMDATLLDADFTRAEINTGTSFSITTGTNFSLTTVGNFTANTNNMDLNAIQNIDIGATQIQIIGEGLIDIISDRTVGITAGDHLLLTADNNYTLNVGNTLLTNVGGNYDLNVTGTVNISSDHHLLIESGATMTIESMNKMYINSITDGICLTANGGDLEIMVTGANIIQTTDGEINMNSGTTTSIFGNDLSIGATNCVVIDAGCISMTGDDHIDLISTVVNVNAPLNITTSSDTALIIQSVTGMDCLVVDTNTCGITIHGTLNVQTLSSSSLDIAGDLGVSGNLSVSGVLMVCDKWIEIDQGSAAAPSIRFCGDPDTGIYQALPNHFNLTTNGINRFQIDGNGDVAIDTNTLYVDAVNNLVGIGSATPTQKLDVNGDALIQGGDLFLVDTDEKIASNGTDMFFHVGGTEVVRFEAGGNVGIGTNNPTAGLDVFQLTSRFGTNTGGQLLISDQTTFTRLSMDELRFWDNNTSNDYAKFDSSNSYILSNLSIGTTVAGDKLYVYGGDARITQTSVEAFVVETLGSHDCFVVDTLNCAVGISGKTVITTNDNNAFVVQGSDKVVLFNFDTNTDQAGITADTYISKTSTRAFVVQDVLENECLIVDTINCAITMAGTLSVNTLQISLVSSDLAVDGNFSVTGTVDFCTAPVRFADGSATNPSLAFCDDLNTGIFSPADDVISLTTNGNERLTVNSTGNVGIGSATPTQKLDVNGDALIQGGDLFLVDTDEKIASNGTDMFFHVGGTEVVRFEAGGNVGIGTNNPTSRHHVLGNSRVQVTDVNAFVVENALGDDCFRIDTTTCETFFNGAVHITSDSTTALNVQNSSGTNVLVVDGLNEQVGVSGDLVVSSQSTGAFVVQGVTGDDCFVVDTVNCTATVYGTLVAATLGISGDLTVTGNLTVQGTETILNTETLTIDDNLITINGITNPTDTNADGGGIELLGDSTYTILWDKDCIHTGYGVTASWDFNQNINVHNTLGYYIDCKVHHDRKNLVVNTRTDSHAGALYLSTNDILNPVTGDWRIATETTPSGVERLLFQRFNGSVWLDRMKIN